ncbi:MAG: hypothetical protein MUO77_05995, partial [Anaerolineales bacterium]|nr:hypothetical protein [Anaerolineales bacterium]
FIHWLSFNFINKNLAIFLDIPEIPLKYDRLILLKLFAGNCRRYYDNKRVKRWEESLDMNHPQ